MTCLTQPLTKLSRRRLMQFGLAAPLLSLPLLQSGACAATAPAADAFPVQTLADMLMKVRQTMTPIKVLPDHLRPRTVDEAYRVQDALINALGGRGGYKANKATPPIEGMVFAQFPKRGILKSGASIKLPAKAQIAAEGEIAYRMLKDLAPRNTPYSDEEILDAVEALPGIEVLWVRFEDMAGVGPYALLADLSLHAAYIMGEPIKDWRTRLPDNPPMRLLIGGKEVFQSDAAKRALGDKNTAPLIWFVNEGAKRFGGLKKGQLVSTGNYTGGKLFEAPAKLELSVPGFGDVSAEVIL